MRKSHAPSRRLSRPSKDFVNEKTLPISQLVSHAQIDNSSETFVRSRESVLNLSLKPKHGIEEFDDTDKEVYNSKPVLVESTSKRNASPFKNKYIQPTNANTSICKTSKWNTPYRREFNWSKPLVIEKTLPFSQRVSHAQIDNSSETFVRSRESVLNLLLKPKHVFEEFDDTDEKVYNSKPVLVESTSERNTTAFMDEHTLINKYIHPTNSDKSICKMSTSNAPSRSLFTSSKTFVPEKILAFSQRVPHAQIDTGSETFVRSRESVLNLLLKPKHVFEEFDDTDEKVYNSKPVLVESTSERNTTAFMDEHTLINKYIHPTNSDKRFFNVVYGKQSKKKHRTWEEDGVLEVGEKSFVLKDSEGKVVGRGMGKENAKLKEGSRLFVGSKEVEIIDIAPTPDKTSKKRSSEEITIAKIAEISKPVKKKILAPMLI